MSDRTDQKFARWLLPCIAEPNPRTEGRLCVLYNLFMKSYTVAELRVVAKMAKQQTFNTVDHLSGWMTLALKNQAKGKGVHDDLWVQARKVLAPPDETGWREIVTAYFVCGRNMKDRGPYPSHADAERAMVGK